MQQSTETRQGEPVKNQELRWRIRELAFHARVNVGDLLSEAGIGWATLSRWYHGKVKPRAETIHRLEQAAERLRGRT